MALWAPSPPICVTKVVPGPDCPGEEKAIKTHSVRQCVAGLARQKQRPGQRRVVLSVGAQVLHGVQSALQIPHRVGEVGINKGCGCLLPTSGAHMYTYWIPNDSINRRPTTDCCTAPECLQLHYMIFINNRGRSRMSLCASGGRNTCFLRLRPRPLLEIFTQSCSVFRMEPSGARRFHL